MQGTRIYPPIESEIKPSEIHAGEYWFDIEHSAWMCCVPNGLWGNLKNHTVTEHDDGMITVSPSILVSGYDYDKKKKVNWHGYLDHGIWREV